VKRTIAGLVAVCLVASACVAAPTAASPSTDVPVLAGIQSPSAAPAMTVTPVPSATPSPTLAVTQPPTATPTKKATPRPTRPSPPASGVWGGAEAGPTSPIAIGATEKLTEYWPTGPICTLTVTYFDGSHQPGLASHDTWKSGAHWTWKWVIPSGTAGLATYQLTCKWGTQTHVTGPGYSFIVTG